MEKKASTKKIVLAVVVLAVVAVLMFLAYKVFMPKGQAGAKEIAVKVIHGDATEKEFTYQTDAEYLGEVLVSEDLVEGEEGQYGLFITAVDGEMADDSKQQWWCITKSGEQVNTSADLTPIADGDVYELTMMEGY